MRINKFVALHSGLSRRAADAVIAQGRVLINGNYVQAGQNVNLKDVVTLDGRALAVQPKLQTILLNKPEGYVVSRDGQGSATIYNLLPPELHNLKPVGRLDKDSSGLLLLTNDGQLAQELTHPKYQKTKVYEISLSSPLTSTHQKQIVEGGVHLDDGISKLGLQRLEQQDERSWRVSMHEGRNRQIRRTFGSLGYQVIRLHRTQFGTYQLPASLTPGEWITITP